MAKVSAAAPEPPFIEIRGRLRDAEELLIEALDLARAAGDVTLASCIEDWLAEG